MSSSKPSTASATPKQSVPTRGAPKFIAFVLAVVVAVRLATLGAYPLGSTTEPRYAEIARKMLESGDWVTPWFDYGVPFWGKPPLSFWGSAATMALLGVNEFAVRLAPFLAAVACGALLWAWPRANPQDRSVPVSAALVFASSVVGFIASAAVMTDMFMALGTTLSMVAFWRAVQPAATLSPWRWWFFVGVAVGLLAKGPVATVITGVATVLWLAWTGHWRHAWQRLPWLGGLLLAALLTLPWYLWAEARTPGFLHYFIVGEHIQRFLVSGWTGDLYGQGHAQPRGLIWWYGFGGFLPWSGVALLAWALGRRGAKALAGSTVPPGAGIGEWRYLVCWTLAPLLFFSVARNILEAYVLPGLPAFALLTALLVLGAARAAPWLHRLWWLGLLAPALWLSWLTLSPQPEARSQRALLRQWPAGTDLVYLGSRPLSANFYAHGQAQLAATPEQAQKWLAGSAAATLVLEDSFQPQLPAHALQGWQVVDRHGGYTLLRRAATIGTAAQPDTLRSEPVLPKQKSP